MTKQMKPKKRLTAILLSIVLVLSMAPVTLLAETSTTVSNPAISDKTSTSAIVSSTIVPGDGINLTRVNLEYSTRSDFANSENIPFTSYTGTSQRSFSESITGLDSNQKYYVRLLVHTSAGTVTSEVSNFTTLAGQTVATIDSTRPSVAYDSSTKAIATSSFSTSGASDITIGYVASRESTSPTLEDYDAKSNAVTVTRAGEFSATLTNLEEGKRYYIRAYITYYNGSRTVTDYSSSNTPYTHNTVGKPTVTTNTASYDDGYVTAKGTIDNIGTSSVFERGFVYSYSSDTPTTNDYSTKASANTEFTKEFTISKDVSKVYIRAYAINDYGTGYGATKTISIGDSKPSISTDSVSNVTVSTVDVKIDVTSKGNTSLLSKGILISKNKDISLESYLDKKVSDNTKVGAETLTISGLDKATKYYVLAYATNSNGTSYGNPVLEFTTTSEDMLTTTTVTEITNTTAVTGGTISRNVEYNPKERGVLYSSSNSTPTIENSKSVVDADTGVGTFSLTLKDLTANTKYYVRAYTKTSQGIEYGNIRNFITSDVSLVTTDSITDIKGKEATIKATAKNDSEFNITERGVVYSKSEKTPTMNNGSSKKDTSEGSGAYSIVIGDLDTVTKYYVRAYVRSNGNYSYGDVKEFTTISGHTVTLRFKLADGSLVSESTMSVSPNTELTADMIKYPEGYTYGGTGFVKQIINQDTTVDLIVRDINAIVEKEFVTGIGAYSFAPSRQVTRLEIAKMIYNLRGNGQTYTGKAFTDVPASLDGANAIAFVSYMGYMQGDLGTTLFRPNDNIKRAEVAVALNKVFSLLPNNSISVNLTDISTHWGRTYITIAAQNGTIAGFEDKTFRPENPMTRADATIIFSLASKRTLAPLGTMDFVDVPKEHYAYKYIMNASIPKP